MGGRGGSGSSTHSVSPEYREHYNVEVQSARDFEASFAIEQGATKDTIGYQMYVHQDVTG